jgi:exopolysaccharide biosynthesis polyprenyl glycosylphosphotransferase
VTDRALASSDQLITLANRPEGRPHISTSRRYARLAIWIGLTDAVSIEAALLLTRLIRYGVARPAGPHFTMLLVLAPLVWVPIFAAFRLYSFSRLSPAEEFRRLFEASGVAVAIKLALSLLTSSKPALEDALSRGWLVLCWFFALVLVMVSREVWHKYMGRRRASGDLAYRTVIMGANDEAVRIAHTLRPPILGYVTVGFVDAGGQTGQVDGTPILGTVGDLSRVISDHDIECVFIASSAMGPDTVKEAMKLLRRHSVEVRVSANMTQTLASRLTVQPVGDLLALSLRPVRLTGPQAILKRTFDLVVGSVLFTLALPLWTVVAVLIKMTSRGSVLYRQERVGREGRLFKIYKFRTMIRGADLMLPDLLHKNEFEGGVLFKLRDDPRVTAVGRWLRRWSLDELPQLLNVLKGDMSLVGPRPALPSEVATYEEWHRDRLEVRPGITGLWQVGGRSELSFDDYVKLDLFYIENWSVIYDLFILGKTIPAVLLRKGAF